jgi:hypothetical protein
MFDGAALNCSARRGDSLFDAYRKKVAITHNQMADIKACVGLDEKACGSAAGCMYYADTDSCIQPSLVSAACDGLDEKACGLTTGCMYRDFCYLL